MFPATGYIHIVGVLFLLQASASFALAALLLAGGPIYVRFGAGGAAAGALGGFAASRTVGVFGFTERGWQPSPQSLTSVLVEVATLLLLAPTAFGMVKRLGGSRVPFALRKARPGERRRLFFATVRACSAAVSSAAARACRSPNGCPTTRCPGRPDSTR